MIKGVAKFTFISLGGLLGLMVIGMIISAIFGVNPKEIKEVDLIKSWTIYRVLFYFLLMLLWIPFCHFVTRPRIDLDGFSEEEKNLHNQKREKAFGYFKSQWWKVALLLAFFEVVIIQQFGL